MTRLLLTSDSTNAENGVATLTFSSPPPNKVWIGSITIPQSDPYDQWLINLAGATGIMYGAGPYGPLEIASQTQLQLVGSNLLTGLQYSAIFTGSEEEDTGKLGAYSLPISPPPSDSPTVFTDYGNGTADVIVAADTSAPGPGYAYRNFTITNNARVFADSVLILVSGLLTIDAGCRLGADGQNAADGGAGNPSSYFNGGGDGGTPGNPGSVPATSLGFFTDDYSGGPGTPGTGAGAAPGLATPAPLPIGYEYITGHKGAGGSGGGSSALNRGGGGGGMLVIFARRIINNGRITANGGAQDTNSGAGGGGTLIVVSRRYEGTGTLEANNGLTTSNNLRKGNVIRIRSN